MTPGRKPTCTCGDCKKCKQREVARRWRERNPDKARATSRSWAQAHPERTKEIEAKARAKRQVAVSEQQRKRYEEFDWEEHTLYLAKQKSARWAANEAIKKGVLVRQPCWCGRTPAHAHHEDYDKPLDVVWLCLTHHGERHRELHKIRREMYGVVPRKIKTKST